MVDIAFGVKLRLIRTGKREESVVLKSACIFLPVLFVTPLASAQSTIFKCVGKNGIEAYSNSPCPPKSGSTVWVQDKNAKNAQVPTELMTRPVPKPGNDAPAVQGEPRVGMTAKEVKAIWGTPTDITQEEGVEGRVDTWSYGESRSVQFDARGRALLQ
jgi:hypothetical protein